MTQLASDAAAQLATLSRTLQQLYSHILDVERRFAPSVAGTALLDRLVNDPAWAWMRALSSLIADIDHVLAQKEPPTDSDRTVAAALVRGMVFGEGEFRNEQFLNRYRPLLQMDSSLASIHGELKGLLKGLPAESENESERLHAHHQWAIRCRHRAPGSKGSE